MKEVAKLILVRSTSVAHLITLLKRVFSENDIRFSIRVLENAQIYDFPLERPQTRLLE